MRFYVLRTCQADLDEPPVTCVPVTSVKVDDFHPDWVMEADSFEDAFKMLMPESPMKEFLVYRMPDDPDDDIEWAIEVYD